MFLKLFRLRLGGDVVREVVFRQGLNLVVDYSSAERTDSGNSVGKTSFLRSIDFCLGGKAEQLFQDPEFPDRVNEDVLNFLEAGATFELTMETTGGRDVVLRRTYNGEMSVDNDEYSGIKAYQARLGGLLFGLDSDRPSFRQLMGKFIRLEEYELTNVLRFLHPSTNQSAYDAMFLFLFGFPNQSLLTRRHRLVALRKKLDGQKKALKARSPSTLAQLLAVIERDIKVLEDQLAAYAVGPEHHARLTALAAIRGQLSDLSIRKSQMDLRLDSALRAAAELETSSVHIDLEVLHRLYEEATTLVPEISRSFDELVAFHNSMVTNKSEYVRSTVESLRTERDAVQERLNELLAKEQRLLSGLASAGAFIDLLELQRRLEELYEQRGAKRALLEELEKIGRELDDTERSLDVTTTEIQAHLSSLQERVTAFNLVFSEYSNRLYGEQYIFSLDLVDGGRRLVDVGLHDVAGDDGTGKKRAKIVAFDLAYTRLAVNVGLRAPRFVLHDQLEVVDTNQLATLFEIAEEHGGQLLVAALQDRVASVEGGWLDRAVVLGLSQDDRFFRV